MPSEPLKRAGKKTTKGEVKPIVQPTKRNRKPFTDGEIVFMRHAWLAGANLKTIAKNIGRKYPSIKTKIDSLIAKKGLMKGEDNDLRLDDMPYEELSALIKIRSMSLDGKSASEIAEALSLPESTVSSRIAQFDEDDGKKEAAIRGK